MFDGLLEAYPWTPSLASRHPTWESCEDEFIKKAMFMIRFCNVTGYYQAWVGLKMSEEALRVSELWIKTHIVPEISSMLAWDRKVAALKAERAAYQSAMRIEDEELTILGRREVLRKAANERAGYVPTTEKYVAMEAAKTKAYKNDVEEVTGFRPGHSRHSDRRRGRRDTKWCPYQRFLEGADQNSAPGYRFLSC
jgi:hypothetical protein